MKGRRLGELEVAESAEIHIQNSFKGLLNSMRKILTGKCTSPPPGYHALVDYRSINGSSRTDIDRY